MIESNEKTTMNSNKEEQQLRKEDVVTFIENGRRKYEQEQDYKQKSEGLKMMIFQGVLKLKKMKENETNELKKKLLEEQEQLLSNECSLKMKELESLKKSDASNFIGKEEKQENSEKQKKQQKQKKNIILSEEDLKLFENRITIQKSNINWEDVSGLEEAKSFFHERIVVPLQYPQFIESTFQAYKGILLYGPPKTGKSQLISALANKIKGNLIKVSDYELMSKQNEKGDWILSLFAVARKNKPSIIFFDRIEEFSKNIYQSENSQAMNILSEFAEQIRICNSIDERDIQFIATSYEPWKIHPTIRRRLQKRIFCPLPDSSTRLLLLNQCLMSIKHNISDENSHKLCGLLDGFSRHEIKSISKSASFEPMNKCKESQKFQKQENGKYIPVDDHFTGNGIEERDFTTFLLEDLNIPGVRYEDFEKLIKLFKPSSQQILARYYQDWKEEFG